METQTIFTENQIKYILSKNTKLTHVMNNVNKTKMDHDGNSSISASSLPVNELGKLVLNFAKEGNAEKILKLIQEGAPFISDWLGMSALHFAAMNNHRDVLELLLRSGLNKDTRTKVDRTALHLAAYHGHADIVDVLLKSDCEVNARDMLKMTPLHWAVERGHKEVVKLLLQHGADVDAVSKFDKTPLSIAIHTGQVELLKDLQDAREVFRSKPQPINDQTQNETNAAVSSILESNDQEDLQTDDNQNIKSDVKVISNKTNKNLSKLHVLNALQSMMEEENENTLLSSALQNGRQLILSEGGKRVLRDVGMIESTSNSKDDQNQKQISEDEKQRRPHLLMKTKPIPLKPPGKNVKILSVDAFKKLYGQNALASIQNKNNQSDKLQKNNITSNLHLTKLTKVTNISEINGKKTVFTPVVPSKNLTQIVNKNKLIQTVTTSPQSHLINSPKLDEADDELSSIIEICNENDSDQEIDEISEINDQIYDSTQNNSNCNINSGSEMHKSLSQKNKVNTIHLVPPSSTQSTSSYTTTKSPSPSLTNKNPVQLLEIPEICRQLQELRKNYDTLRRELELTRIENEEYKMRLERLECRVDEQQLTSTS